MSINYICINKNVKKRYFIFISFKGTSYHGWQIQANSVTVQMVLDDALSLICNEKISTTGAGRTDTGVHALVFCAHFDCLNADLTDRKKIIYRLNSLLPKDISVRGIFRVRPDAHARYSAIARTYQYYVAKTKDPFLQDYAWHVNSDIDINMMNKACSILSRHTDFTSFSKLHSDTKTNFCTIYLSFWEETDKTLVFTIKADRFLRNMVRAIVGTMIETGTGKISPDEFERIIQARDRCKAGRSVPAKGLFLVNIEYPAELFIRETDHSKSPTNGQPEYGAF